MYTDAESLLAEWLTAEHALKTWVDPRLPDRWDYTAPLVHIQRGPGSGDSALSLDDALIDVEVYAKIADNARVTAEIVRRAIRVQLLKHTTTDGTFIQATRTVMAPVWLPDPTLFRRGATYRLVLHTAAL